MKACLKRMLFDSFLIWAFNVLDLEFLLLCPKQDKLELISELCYKLISLS